MNPLHSITLLVLGILSVVLFHADIFFPLWLSVIVYIGVSIYFLHFFRQKRIGVLLGLLWVVYFLPFIHIPPYLWFDFAKANPSMLWGLAVNPYMFEERIIQLTAMLGAVGGIGMALGIALSFERLKKDDGFEVDGKRRRFSTLSLPLWLGWLIIGAVLSWLAAPQETIFTLAYTESTSVFGENNFNSAWMMSYVVLTFTFCDALLDSRPLTKKIKLNTNLATIAFVVIYFQFLRGDRESVSWIFALALVYFYWAVMYTRRKEIDFPVFKISMVVVFLVGISMIIGVVRHSSAGLDTSGAIFQLLQLQQETGTISLSNILHGTWSAVLLTPLSVAGDYINDLLALKLGKDYYDLILSIPPGFLTDAIGLSRPIDALHGPAWEMRYGLGGTHASVVPFMNFRMAGVFLTAVIWTYLVTRFEKIAIQRVSVVNLSLLVTIAMASPHWLWYGDKYGLNAFILWLILAFLYRISLTIQNK